MSGGAFIFEMAGRRYLAVRGTLHRWKSRNTMLNSPTRTAPWPIEEIRIGNPTGNFVESPRRQRVGSAGNAEVVSRIMAADPGK